MTTHRKYIRRLLSLSLLLAAMAASAQGAALTIEVDASQTVGTIRDLFGVNKKPSFSSKTPGATVNASNLYSAFGISQVRLHDSAVDLCSTYSAATKLNSGLTPAQTISGCELAGSGSVPHFTWTPTSSADADLNNPDNYDFSLVDQALSQVASTGAAVYLRLGESYNGPNDTADPVAWAKVATNIYKHVIGVFKPTAGIVVDPAYVEVFNEPDGGFWRGQTATFNTLFVETVQRVRAAAAAAGKSVRIGGAGFTRSILTSSTVSGNPANGFINAVGAANLDFYSAHLYNTCSTATLSSAADFLRALRALVDGQGGSTLPIHLSEWNIGLGSQCGNDFFAEQRTQSFDSGLLTLLQDPSLNIEAAHFYAAVPIMALFDFTSVPGTARINPAAWAFWAHTRLRGANRLSTMVCQGSTCLAGDAAASTPLLALAAQTGIGQSVVVTNDSATSQTYTLRAKGQVASSITATINTPPAGTYDLSAVGNPAVADSSGLQALLGSAGKETRSALAVTAGLVDLSITIPARTVQVIELRASSPSLTAQADCVFSWGERHYPELFQPRTPASQSSGDYFFRHYPTTGTYLGVSFSEGKLLYLDTRTSSEILDLGPLSGWLPQAGCQ